MLDFLLEPANSETVWIVILLTGLVTYITRSGGFVVLSRFKSVHPRLKPHLKRSRDRAVQR